MRYFFVTIFLLTLSFVSLNKVRAQQAEGEKEPSKDKVIYRKSQKLQFSGSKLKGQYKKPELSYIYERKGIKQEQIIHIPDDFDREIINGTTQF